MAAATDTESYGVQQSTVSALYNKLRDSCLTSSTDCSNSPWPLRANDTLYVQRSTLTDANLARDEHHWCWEIYMCCHPHLPHMFELQVKVKTFYAYTVVSWVSAHGCSTITPRFSVYWALTRGHLPCVKIEIGGGDCVDVATT